MSTTTSPRTVQQRSVAATARLREILGLTDLKLLATALAEVAAEEAARNRAFADRIWTAYQDLASLQASRPTRSAKGKPADVALVPLPGTEGIRYDPYAPLDPYLLLRIYGAGQLRLALSVYSLTKLKQAAEPVERRNPGTRPTNRSKKESIIDYIVEHVAGPGY